MNEQQSFATDSLPNGLERFSIASDAGSLEVFRQGAHVTAWTPAGHRPVLFMSSRSQFAPGKAIRGGVPVIFPWFGNRSDGQPGPAHGFARTALWTLDSPQPSFSLVAESLEATFQATLLPAALELRLTVHNAGESTRRFENALHTYFAVSDVREVTVSGLENTAFLDKTDGFARKQSGGEPLRLTGETDSVYLDTTTTCTITDPAWQRRIVIAKSGSNTTVVWNPWAQKCAAMADMGPEDWTGMLCVESANAAENAILLAAGESHTMTVRFTVESV